MVDLRCSDRARSRLLAGPLCSPVAAILSFLPRSVTLGPGDIIPTGTPSGVGSATGTYLQPGDIVQASIGGIGALENPVESED